MKQHKNNSLSPPGFSKLILFVSLMLLFVFSNAFAEISLEISSGTLFQTDGEIFIDGDWTNEGNFESEATVNLVGSTTQTITKVGGEQFFNLIINNQNLNFNPGVVKIAGAWENKTTYDCNGVNVIFNGIGEQLFAGNQFYTVTVDKTSGKLWTDSHLIVTNSLNFTNGNIYTGKDTYQGTPYVITLDNSANLVNERDGNYLVGWLQTTRAIGANQTSDFGDIGFELGTAPEDWGDVTITRVSGDTLLSVGGSYHFNRRWKIEPTNTPTMGRDLYFSWVTDDEDSLNLNWVQVWKSVDSPDYAVPGAWDPVGLPENISGADPHSITARDSVFQTDESDTSYRWWTVNDDNVDMDFPPDFVVRTEDIQFTENTNFSPHKVNISSVIRTFYIEEATDVNVSIYAKDLDLEGAVGTQIHTETITFPANNPYESINIDYDWSPPFYHDYEITVEIDPAIEDDELNNIASKNLSTQALSPPDIAVDADSLDMILIGSPPLYDVRLKIPVQATKPLGAKIDNVTVKFLMNDLGDASRADQIIGETIINFTNGQMDETQYAHVDWLPIPESKRSEIGSYYMPDRHYEHNYQVTVAADTLLYQPDGNIAESNEANNADKITEQLMDFVPPDFRIISDEIQFSPSTDDTKPVKIKSKIYADSLITYLNDLEMSFYYEDLEHGGGQVFIGKTYLSYQGTGNKFTTINWLPLYYREYDVTVVVNSDNRYTESSTDNNTANKLPKLKQNFKPDIYLEGHDYVFEPTGSKPYDAIIDVPFHVIKYVKNMPDILVSVKAKNMETGATTPLHSQTIAFTQSNKYESFTVEDIFWDLPASDVPDYTVTARVDESNVYDENPNEGNNVKSKKFGGVKILNVTANWDHYPSDPTKIGRFIPRISLENDFTAEISDPNNMGIEKVEFDIDGTVYEDTDGSDGWNLLYDVGTLQWDPNMVVTAYDSWGIATQSYVVKISTLDELEWLKYILSLASAISFTECENTNTDSTKCKEVALSPVTVNIDDDGNLVIEVAIGEGSYLEKKLNKKGTTTEDAKGVDNQDTGGSPSLKFTFKYGLLPNGGLEGRVDIGFSDKICGESMPFDVNAFGSVAFAPDWTAEDPPKWELDYAEAGLGLEVEVFNMPETVIYEQNLVVIKISIKLSMDIKANIDLLFYLGPDGRFKVDRNALGRITKASHLKLGPTVTGTFKVGVGDAAGCFEVGCAASPSLSLLFYVNWYHENQEAGTEKGKVEVEPGMEVLFGVDGSLYISVLWGLYTWEFLQTNLLDVTCDIPFTNLDASCCGASFMEGLFKINEDCYFGSYGRGSPPIVNVPPLLPYPSMVADSQGNIITIFTREVIDPNYPELTDAEIFYFTRDPENSISEPIQITDNNVFETNPVFNLFNDDAGLLIWTQNRITKEQFSARSRSGNVVELPEATANQDIYYSLWDGESWTTGAPIIADSLENLKSDGMVSFDVLSDTSAVACWVRATGDSTQHREGWQIYYSVLNDSTWSAPTQISEQGSGNFGVQVAANDEADEAMAVWSHLTDYESMRSPYNVYSARWSSEDSTWTAPEAIENSDAQNRTPDITYLNDGSAIATWIRENTVEIFREVEVFDSLAVDTLWISPNNFYVDTVDVYETIIVRDTILVSHLMASQWDSAAGWSTPEVAVIDSQLLEMPKVSTNNQGLVIVTFRKSSSANTAGDLYAVVKNYATASPWSEPRQLTDDPYVNMSLASQIDAMNNSVVVSQTWDFEDTVAARARWRGEKNIDPYGGLRIMSRGVDGSGEFFGGMNMGYTAIAPDFKIKDEWIMISDRDTTDFVSDTLSVGDSLWIRVPVKNVGYTPSEEAAVLHMYNAPPDSSFATLLDSISIPVLDVDQEYNAEFNLLASEENSDLYFVVNPDSLLEEQTRFNNTAHASYHLLPDFTITDIWLSDENPYEGETIQIACEVANLMGSKAYDVPVVCREDVSDTAWKWFDVGTTQYIDSLAVGQQDTVYFPYIVTSGVHRFHTSVNPDSSVTETDYSNNSPTSTGVVALYAFTNLKLVEESIISTTGDGTFTTIEATIINTSQFTATAIPVELFDGHPVLETTHRIDTLTVAMLGPGQSVTVEFTFAGSGGQHDLQIWVNQARIFEERDYTDNSAEFTIYQLPTPDLSFSPDEMTISHALPDPADTVTVTAVLRNLGQESATDIPVWLYRVDGEELIAMGSVLIDELAPTGNSRGREISKSRSRRRSISASKVLSSNSKIIKAKSKERDRDVDDPMVIEFEFVIEDSLSGLTQYQIIANPDMEIAESDYDNNQVEFYLNISGTSGQAGKLIASSPDSLWFGRIKAGCYDTLKVRLSNTGDQVLTISDLQFGASGMFDLDVEQSSFILSPGIEKEIGVVFVPQDSVNEINDTLFVMNNSTNAPELQVKLAGFSISPPIVDIPDVALESNAPQILFADLDEYVTDTDGDSVIWEIVEYDTTKLDSAYIFGDNSLKVVPNPTVYGESWITLKAIDPDSLSDFDRAMLMIPAINNFDVNSDGIIDILDVQMIAAKLGIQMESPDYRPSLDYNSDGVIDEKDLKLIIAEWKK